MVENFVAGDRVERIEFCVCPLECIFFPGLIGNIQKRYNHLLSIRYRGDGKEPVSDIPIEADKLKFMVCRSSERDNPAITLVLL